MEKNEDIQRAPQRGTEGTVDPRSCHENVGKERNASCFPSIPHIAGGREGEAKKEKRAETRLDLHLGGAGEQAARSRRTVALWFGGSLEKEEGNFEICAGAAYAI